MGVQLNAIVWKEAAKQKYIPPIEPLPADDAYVIAGEGNRLSKWSGKDVKDLMKMWRGGLALSDIVRAWPDRDPGEAKDLWRYCRHMRWIEDRPGGIYGRRKR